MEYIKYEEGTGLFCLETANSTYQMKVDKFGYLIHLYYGKKVTRSMDYLLVYYDRGFSGNPYEAEKDRTYSYDSLPQEFPAWGNGDYRTSCFEVQMANGTYGCHLKYKSHCIKDGKYALEGLPAVYADASEAQTLEILMEDELSGLNVTLLYGVIPQYDAITRALKVENKGTEAMTLQKVSSASLDLLSGEYDLITLCGRYPMERQMQRAKITRGTHVVGSRRGTSSHHYNPFMIVAEPQTTEEYGSCYGMSFVYSGNFKAEVEKDHINQIRMTMGLQDERFAWDLQAGESFIAPEVVMVYSAEGLGNLSRCYHKLYRRHLCRGKYKTIPRPVLINNWEATYFDFTGDRIFEIAKKAKELGVEMMVLDDGWFGKRNSDLSSLGDWYVNEEKLDGTLKELVERVNGIDMKFGIWMEPEMVSENSDLYREHPDWAFITPGRKPDRSRFQLVLDFSRPEVVDAIFNKITAVLDNVNVEYIKWDMNRSIADVYSATKDAKNQGEVLHRYVLGVYDFQERLLARYPHLLLEGCCGGGGRFDAGMLYYSPQIWCSDNTDALNRVFIQHGTSFGYPISAVGSHVSAVPNHQTGRSTSLKLRGVVAMAGSFGYELDLGKLSDEEKEEVKQQITDFHKYWNVIHNGDYYRLTNPHERKDAAAWQFVSEDKKETLINIVTLECQGQPPVSYIKAAGLNPEYLYEDTATGKVYEGAALMSAGFYIPMETGEYRAYQMYLVAK